MKRLYILVGMILYCGLAIAQTRKNVTPLNIGDILPDFNFSNIINYNHASLSFADFKGKAIILDFWATYCGSCLAHFPIADSLQKEFNNNLQIILIDGPYKSETIPNVTSVLRKYDTKNHRFSLPSIINDRILIPLFPHQTIPHYVWIDQNRKIRAITAGEDLTRDNVKRFLSNNRVPEYTKKDFDHRRPLYTVDDLPLDKLQEYSIFLKGNIEGIGNGGIREINGTPRGINLHNRPLIDMYLRLRSELIPGPQDNRLLIEVKDSSKLMYLPKFGSYSDWIKNNRYSYELIVPADEMGYLYQYAVEDLNRYTAYIIKVEKRREYCWRLVKEEGNDLIATKGGTEENKLDDLEHPRLINQPIYSLLIFLSKICGKAFVIDETNYNKNIDLIFNMPVNDIMSLNDNLNQYGLKVIPGFQEIDMMVVKDKH